MEVDEVQRIRDSYRRRTQTYDPWEPWIVSTREERERRFIEVLRAAGMFPPYDRTLLDVGCGTGSNLLFFLRLGFVPENLHGIDLLTDRVDAARALLPRQVTVAPSEASAYEGAPNAFDIAFQSMLFSSVLDVEMRQRIADNMWRMVRPGGGVLWYDFTWSNPQNPDVRGVPVSEIARLFPRGRLMRTRATLAPPIARIVGRYCPRAYGVINILPLLRTHVVAWIEKPSNPV